MEGIVSLHIPSRAVESDVECDMVMIPYYSWNNRKVGNTMVVWVPENEETAEKTIPGYGYLDEIASIEVSSNTARSVTESICDDDVASEAREILTPYWSSAGKSAREEIIVRFKDIKKLSGITVYWIDRNEPDGSDKGRRIMKTLSSWKVECLSGGVWSPLLIGLTEECGVESGHLNEVNADFLLPAKP